MYDDTDLDFNFSSGWLEWFKARHGIKSYRKFTESGSVIMENIENALPKIQAKLDKCFKNVNIGNLNCYYRANKKAWVTGLHFQEFVRWFDNRMADRNVLLIVGNCPAHPNVIEGLKNVELFFLPPNTTSKIQSCDVGSIRTLKTTSIANCFKYCKIRSEEGMYLEQEIGDVEGIHGLEEVISNLHYRNAMNIDQILNYPSENKALMESPTDEEIIEGVMCVPANDDQDPDDSNILPHVSPKEAFLAIETLKN
eukprot:XP_015573052.1 uncharacterized protein LOC107261047 [Ricinus communis]